MANMSPKRNEMPTQAPHERASNFKEVALGYSEDVAIDEANRCLNCKNMPCVDGCPVKIHIPEFISKIREGDFEGAYQVISRSSSRSSTFSASANSGITSMEEKEVCLLPAASKGETLTRR